MTTLSQSLGFYLGLVVHGVCDVTGICDATVVIMVRAVLPYIEELNFIMAGLGTSCLQETLSILWLSRRIFVGKQRFFC
jgi:hypothetical protein